MGRSWSHPNTLLRSAVGLGPPFPPATGLPMSADFTVRLAGALGPPGVCLAPALAVAMQVAAVGAVLRRVWRERQG
ncbi:hypothetical protein [Streptomyces sp. ME18-1-4]|uniref:hypothetical protein n=1 Tax=Streptomyces sp. ME18-1-4 TaxID=3028685 RepID=UPI0029A12BEB|nr:hypothetical protein [Streptomyces sp. ME18-1-4]MDX3242631.1 hypothetical protein [Streptomyces sp. ME18-1-4]